MALDIGRLISDIYSAHSSPSATWAREGLAKEKKKALDEENERKRLLQGDIEAGATTRTQLSNEGNLAVRKEQSAGELARQGLANVGAVEQARVTGELGLEGHRAISEATKYVADQSLTGTKYKADSDAGSARYSGPDELLKAHQAIIRDSLVSPEDKALSMEYIQARTRQALGQSQGAAPDGVIGERPASTVSPTATPPPPVSPAGGRASMTFDTDMGTAKVAQPKKRKESLDTFYRLNPGVRRVLE